MSASYFRNVCANNVGKRAAFTVQGQMDAGEIIAVSDDVVELSGESRTGNKLATFISLAAIGSMTLQVPTPPKPEDPADNYEIRRSRKDPRVLEISARHRLKVMDATTGMTKLSAQPILEAVSGIEQIVSIGSYRVEVVMARMTDDIDGLCKGIVASLDQWRKENDIPVDVPAKPDADGDEECPSLEQMKRSLGDALQTILGGR